MYEAQRRIPRGCRESAQGRPGGTRMAIQAAELLRSGRARRAGTEPNVAIPEGHASAVVLRRDQMYRRMLALADATSAALAICFAALIIGPNRIEPAALIALPGVVL